MPTRKNLTLTKVSHVVCDLVFKSVKMLLEIKIDKKSKNVIKARPFVGFINIPSEILFVLHALDQELNFP